MSAIDGAEDAALFIGAVGMAEDSGEEPVGIAGIYGEGGNLLAVREAEMCPVFPASLDL